MEASNALGCAGIIFIIALVILGFTAYNTNVLEIQDHFNNPFIEKSDKVFTGVALGVAFLFLAIPGLMLLWMCEIGNELERNANNTKSSKEVLNNLSQEIKEMNRFLKDIKTRETT
jgi:amino acid transporter